MIGKYLPPKIINFILGMNFSLFSINFISLKDIPYALAVKDYFAFPQKDEYLNEIGLASGSAFVNNLRLTILFAVILIIHLFVFLSKYLKKTPNK